MRCSLTLLAILPFASPVAIRAADPTKTAKPNILFLVSDDLRPELGCYGNAVVKSPSKPRLHIS